MKGVDKRNGFFLIGIGFPVQIFCVNPEDSKPDEYAHKWRQVREILKHRYHNQREYPQHQHVAFLFRIGSVLFFF
ncbi:hypothetical protein SDC9_198054 [bioreactor metagenome]|uniref:Uncharacterized protein n=1 Tax=bioreactor metagenome TaxID=1076179 RepID=A0A645IGJ6_9ZZZZ